MKPRTRRRWLWLFAALLPVALYAVIAERNSWRPHLIHLTEDQQNLRLRQAMNAANASVKAQVSRVNAKLPVGERLGGDVSPLYDFSPDGKVLATADTRLNIKGDYGFEEAFLRTFDTNTGRLICYFPLTKTITSVNEIGFSPDGLTLYAMQISSGATILHGWRLNDGKPTLEYKVSGEFEAFVLSPDGADMVFLPRMFRENNRVSLQIVINSKKLLLHHLKSRQPDRTLLNPDGVLTGYWLHNGKPLNVSFASEGKALMAFGENYTLTLWRIK